MPGKKAVDAISFLPPALQKIARNSVDFPNLQSNPGGVWKTKGAHLTSPVTSASSLRFQDLQRGLNGFGASWKTGGAHFTSPSIRANQLRFRNLRQGLMGFGQTSLTSVLTPGVLVAGVAAFLLWKKFKKG